jgi:integrase
MAKLRRGFLFKRGSVYYAGWYIGDRKFVKTTGQTDRREAEKEQARIMEPYLVKDEVKTLQSVQVKIAGAEAELARLEDQRNPPLAVNAAWDAFVKSPGHNTGESTMQVYSYIWKQFLAWLTKNHVRVKLMREVTNAVAEDYAGYLKARGVTGKTYNSHRAVLLMVFRLLADKARMDRNPWAAIVRMKYKTQGRRALTVDELRKVCSTATGDLRTLLALGLYLGARLGDACCMEWGSVDMKKRVVAYTQRKTGRSVTIPMHPVLHAILDEIPMNRRRTYVLPDMAKLYLEKAPHYVTNTVQAHLMKCGLVTTREGKGLRRVVSAGFHSLRHAAVSLLRDAGAPLSVTMAIVGHSTIAMHDAYTHAGEAAIKQAVAALPSVMGTELPALPAHKIEPAETAFRSSLRAVVDKLDGQNWYDVKQELLGLLPVSQGT